VTTDDQETNQMENRISANADQLYELYGVDKRYGDGDAEVAALRDVELTIGSGQFVVVAGPSGSGKSTLLQLLGGLDRASSGSVRFEGTDLGSLGDARLADLRLNTFGFIFQQFNLIPTLTAATNVEAALAPDSMSTEQRQRRVAELLELVGLAPRADHLPSQLSGGEQQRVAIARALANSPRVLLADEPTGNLDSKTGSEVLGLLREIAQREGQTVVLVTHDPAIADAAPVLLRMQDGIILNGDPVPAPVPAQQAGP
jgi:putative ABC transport system ATP-binding protein